MSLSTVLKMGSFGILNYTLKSKTNKNNVHIRQRTVIIGLKTVRNVARSETLNPEKEMQILTFIFCKFLAKWSHIDDLDDFFTRVYQYHQNHGIFALVFSEILNLFQILFLAGFSIFMIDCVDYKTLFQSQKVINNSFNDSVVKKNTIHDVVFPLNLCVKRWIFHSFTGTMFLKF